MDTRFLEVDDFVAEREGELPRLHLLRDIGTREGPVEDGDWTGQHSLHGLLREALRVAAPADSHGVGAANVRDNNGRANVAA